MDTAVFANRFDGIGSGCCGSNIADRIGVEAQCCGGKHVGTITGRLGDRDIAIAIDFQYGGVAIGTGCCDRRTVNRYSIGFCCRGYKAAKLLGTCDIMTGECLHIERIAHANSVQRDIPGASDNHLTVGADFCVEIQLTVEDLSRIVRVARCAQQGRGARARGQRFGESGHWMLLSGRRKSYAG